MQLSKSDLKIRRRRVRHAILLCSGHGGGDTMARELSELGVRDIVTVREAGGLAAALRSLPPDVDVLISDGAAMPPGRSGSPWLAELLTDRRENVVAVVPRLRHQLDASMVKFELEPVDVPWYSRRIVALGAELERGHGESLGCFVIGGAARSVLEADDALGSTVSSLAMHLIGQGVEVYAHAVAAEASREVADGALLAAI